MTKEETKQMLILKTENKELKKLIESGEKEYSITRSRKINLGNYEQDSVMVTSKGSDPQAMMIEVNDLLIEEVNRIISINAEKPEDVRHEFATTEELRRFNMCRVEQQIDQCKTEKDFDDLSKFLKKATARMTEDNRDKARAYYAMKKDEVVIDATA